MNNAFASLIYGTRRHLGTAGLIGILLLALAAVCVWMLQPQASQHLAQLESKLQAVRTDTSKNAPRELAAPSTVLQLRKFFEWLPQVGTNAADVQTLFSLAKEVQLDLAKADYQITSDPNARLIRYQIILPVKEHYPTVRKFASLALAKLPHMALDEFVITRQQAASNVIEAQLQLTLFYKAQ